MSPKGGKESPKPPSARSSSRINRDSPGLTRSTSGNVRPASARRSDKSGTADGRVRVAVRLRPVLDFEKDQVKDSAPVIEVESEVNRVIVKRDHWDSDAYTLDSAYSPTTSQRRLYEEFCMPVVDSVLKGYNGTVMAYGQTGTGKTYTLGNLGTEDSSQRGIVVRSMEHILTTAREDQTGQYKITLSYLQLYMEAVLDLLEPEKDQLTITEDPTSGEVICNGSKVVEVTNMEGLLQILKIGEDNRVVANQKLNATSSRSHSLLIITVKRLPNDKSNSLSLQQSVTALKGKLLIVDLAGSERISKSGSEGHMLEEAKFINLSLTALGKCIYSLTDPNPAHIPYRDSKLTRLLKDSFGGTARTSLIVNISPLRAHISETSSALQFGQRALKIENTTKIREEVDMRLLNQKLQAAVDHLNDQYEKANSKVAAVSAQLTQERAAKADVEAALVSSEAKVAAEKAAAEQQQKQYRQMLIDQEIKLRTEMEISVASERATKQMAEGKVREMETASKAMEVDYYAAKEEAAAAKTVRAKLEADLEEERAKAAKLQAEHMATSHQLAVKESLVSQMQETMAASSEQKERMHVNFLQEARTEVKVLEKELAEAKAGAQLELDRERAKYKTLMEENARLASQLESSRQGALPEVDDGQAKRGAKFWKVGKQE
eukprot:CAMPEP_0118924650 /NCGR_PEP_ID=MMETSP1169-20130426/2689_1 /TAXON_ID=36882 /ORGANISM="Pyramimonas obovata, Strain CCMP722" /LENGTH=661 /DNA_ID=CAMNT_0006865781 /DNA_START=135 /DNA_END=2117 /DNA_ORIENTATION=-